MEPPAVLPRAPGATTSATSEPRSGARLDRGRRPASSGLVRRHPRVLQKVAFPSGNLPDAGFECNELGLMRGGKVPSQKGLENRRHGGVRRARHDPADKLRRNCVTNSGTECFTAHAGPRQRPAKAALIGHRGAGFPGAGADGNGAWMAGPRLADETPDRYRSARLSILVRCRHLLPSCAPPA